jgi:type VI secretion system secreted protein VgrG
MYYPERRQPIASENIEYLVVRTSHSFGTQHYRTIGQSADPEAYHGTYELQPSSRPFRAPIVTPAPRIHGIQTAKVVTKTEGGGEEIDVEKLTEIYVWFYWDRKQHDEPKRSCKIRVAQIWAQKKWGSQYIPRVGQEVVVQFLDGDPDRPLVIGTVYNDENKPPYDLPGNKTMTGMKSNSTKGGGGFNEFIFEDKKNSENIRMHAQKDYNVTILNTETVTIGEKYTEGKNSRSTTLVKGSDGLIIAEGNQSLDIVKGSQSIHIKKDQTINVDGHVKETISSGHEQTITGDSKIAVTGAINQSATSKIEKLTLSVAGSSVEITSSAITITAAGSTIKVDASGVSLTGPKISLNG